MGVPSYLFVCTLDVDLCIVFIIIIIYNTAYAIASRPGKP